LFFLHTLLGKAALSVGSGGGMWVGPKPGDDEGRSATNSLVTAISAAHSSRRIVGVIRRGPARVPPESARPVEESRPVRTLRRSRQNFLGGIPDSAVPYLEHDFQFSSFLTDSFSAKTRRSICPASWNSPRSTGRLRGLPGSRAVSSRTIGKGERMGKRRP
jgi:hypothetical protein